MQGFTLADKIISEHCGREAVAGDIVVADVDICLLQDGTGPLAVRSWRKLGTAAGRKVAHPEKTVLFLDHAAPSPRKELSNDHQLLRDFARQHGCVIRDIGDGVCHQVIAEEFVRPGDILVGADSHSCTAGALGCFATGMGSTDVAAAIALGKTWFRVPQTFKIVINGKLAPGVYPKDIILCLIGIIGADGGTYKALEFSGETVEAMSVSERMTLSNMAVEAGGKAGLAATDKKTQQAQGRGDDYREVKPDVYAEYEKVIEIEAGELVPQVALPHRVDKVKPIDQIEKTKIDQVFIGTCTNGRLDDLELTARIWQGKKRNPRTRVIVAPASRKVFTEAVEKGIVKTMLEFGATFIAPGCGPCVGVHGGALADGENCLATQNRNFLGRMGNPKGFIYLASPATAAVSAITGEITDPRGISAKTGEKI